MGWRAVWLVAAAAAVVVVVVEADSKTCKDPAVAERYPCLCEMNSRPGWKDRLVGGWLPLGMGAGALVVVLLLAGGLAVEAWAVDAAEARLMPLMDAVLRSSLPVRVSQLCDCHYDNLPNQDDLLDLKTPPMDGPEEPPADADAAPPNADEEAAPADDA